MANPLTSIIERLFWDVKINACRRIKVDTNNVEYLEVRISTLVASALAPVGEKKS